MSRGGGGKFGVGRTGHMARVIPGNGDRSRPFRASIADPSPAVGATDALVECDEHRGYAAAVAARAVFPASARQ